MNKETTKNFGNLTVIFGVTLIIIGLLPCLPWYVLIPLGVALLYIASQLKSESAKNEKEPLLLELGDALITLIDEKKGAELVKQIKRIHHEISAEKGFEIPEIRIINNMCLEPNEYCFKIRGVTAYQRNIRMGYCMCINTGNVTEELDGEKTTDPVSGLPAIWVTEQERECAERVGYSVLDSAALLSNHLSMIIKAHIAEININRKHDMIGAKSFIEIIKKRDRQLRNKKWLKARCLDANNTEQIAIDMTGSAYNLSGEYNEHFEKLNKEEAVRNEIVLKKLVAKWDDIFEQKDFFEEMTFKDNTHFEQIGNLSGGGFIQSACGSPRSWNHIASVIKSKYLERAFTRLKYTTKDNNVLSMGIKKEAFGAVIVFLFISEESSIKMHIYITPHGAPDLPDLREPDIIDGQINIKLPKNKADAKRITIDDIFAKLGIEKFWEKAGKFEKKFQTAFAEASNKNLEEKQKKQIEISAKKVQADIEKLNKTLSELDSI